jgi:hypothetical protein
MQVGEFNKASDLSKVEEALQNAIKSGASKIHIKKLRCLLKVIKREGRPNAFRLVNLAAFLVVDQALDEVINSPAEQFSEDQELSDYLRLYGIYVPARGSFYCPLGEETGVSWPRSRNVIGRVLGSSQRT